MNKLAGCLLIFCRCRDNQLPKHYPKPNYSFCNAGHLLQEVYDEHLNAFVWDCPICIARMREAEIDEEENGMDAEMFNYLYGSGKDADGMYRKEREDFEKLK